MKNRDDLDHFYEHLKETILNTEDDEFYKYFSKYYKSGENTLYQKNISETKKFDKDWIVTIESYIPSLDKIIKNPRSFIRYDEDVVDIDRAKKTNQKSVQHLASHTQYIRNIEDGNIRPSKILSITPEQDFNIYENRFIATLINRLYLFVRNRLTVIKENVESYQKDHVAVDSDFNMKDITVSYKLDVSIKKDLDNAKINEHNYELLARAQKLEALINSLKNSSFMQMMKKSSLVRPPIQKTNVILKNPDFKNAYNLWIYLDKYSYLDYDVAIREKNIKFDTEFQKDIERLTLISISTIMGDQSIRNHLFNITEDDAPLVKKRNKQLKDNVLDFVDDPNSLEIEDNTLNEYFLKKYKSLFDESVKEVRYNGKLDTDEAMKKALRKTTDIVNGLYNSIFEFESEKDIFKRLVKEDLEKEYEDLKYKLKFAKVIREIKQVDYNQAMRREKKLLKDLEKVNKRFILVKKQAQEEALSGNIIKNLEKEIKAKTEEIEKLKKQIEIVGNEDELLNYEKDALNSSRDEIYNDANRQLQIYKREYKAKIQELKSQHQQELKKLKAEANELNKEFLKKEKKRVKDFIKKLGVTNKIVLEEAQKRNEDYIKSMNEFIDNENKEFENDKVEIEVNRNQINDTISQEAKEQIAIQKVLAYELKQNKKKKK